MVSPSNNQLSDCHHAPARVEGRTTKSYYCNQCNQACDLWVASNNLKDEILSLLSKKYGSASSLTVDQILDLILDTILASEEMRYEKNKPWISNAGGIRNLLRDDLRTILEGMKS